MRTLRRIIQTPVLSILLLTVFSLINSENTNAQDFKMGLSVNPNLSWMVSTDYDHTTDGAKLNFGFEFVADILMSENYSFGTGIHVFNTGGSINYLTNENEVISVLNTVERDYSLKYVEIPLTFKMRTKEIGYSTIYGRFGLGLGLNIRAEAEERQRTSWVAQPAEGGWQDFDGEWSEVSNPEVDSDIRILRTAMIIGAGVERSLGGSSSLIIGVTYNVGILNSHKDVEQWALNNGVPNEEASTDPPNYLKGHDDFVEMSLGILF
jgi:hypothetical protein